jgi:hypothetical protein
MYEIEITDEKKLLPKSWKKVKTTKSQQLELFNKPIDKESLKINLSRIYALGGYDVRDKDYRVISSFFDDAYRKMGNLPGKARGYVDINEFRQVVNHVIDERLVPAFEQWFESKFGKSKTSPKRIREIGEAKELVFINKTELYNQFKNEAYDDWSEGAAVQQIIEKGVKDERVLTLNDLIYFKTLKKTITEKQLGTIFAWTKMKRRFPDYKMFYLLHFL